MMLKEQQPYSSVWPGAQWAVSSDRLQEISNAIARGGSTLGILALSLTPSYFS